MSNFTVKWHGTNALLAWAAARRALHATGDDIAQEARDNCYPGHAYDTGELQASIVCNHTGPDTCEVYAGTDHAIFPEFGTVHMAARPYLRPAIAHHWPKTLVAYVRAQNP